MSRSRNLHICAVAVLLAGCQTTANRSATPANVIEPSVMSAACRSEPIDATITSATPPATPTSAAGAVRTSFEEEAPAPSSVNPVTAPLQEALTLPWLMAEVEARNPSLQAMAAAWRAAAARYPQAISLEDPMFMAMAAPASFGSDDVEAAYALQLNQKFPWFGKRAARGRQAAAEANAAYHDLEDGQVQLGEVVQIAFYDYYLARRNLELNRENIAVMQRFRSTAQAKYRANQVTQQDELQATVELAELEREGIEFERMDRVAAARINTLLRVGPFDPLPPPPQHLDSPVMTLDGPSLQLTAETQRPDLAALAEKVHAEEAALTLACKEYYPDLDLFGRYDTFWQPADTQSDLRPQVGATINLPIYRGRLNAAVTEAFCRLNQRRAEYEQRRLDIDYEVANAVALVEESRRTVAVYADKLIPAAEQNIAAASANYDVGKISFLDLALAQRQSIELRRKQEEALATYHTRLAQLQRAIGTKPSGEGRVICNQSSQNSFDPPLENPAASPAKP